MELHCVLTLRGGICAVACSLTCYILGAVQVRTIAELVLAQTAARLAERDIGLEVTAAAMARVCELGYDQVRPPSPSVSEAFGTRVPGDAYTFCKRGLVAHPSV